jgi:hypothetical protein
MLVVIREFDYDRDRYLKIELQHFYIKRGTDLLGLLQHPRTEFKVLTPDGVVLRQYPVSHLVRRPAERCAVNNLREGKLRSGSGQDAGKCAAEDVAMAVP